ncbi:MAG: ligase-associated DNA damage response endonuclease PdeM [Rhodocyclaceae bacterium]
MSDEDIVIALAGQTVHLLPERAVYWPAKRMLLVADVHLGKSSVFRHHGIAVPAGTTADNLVRLDACLARCCVDRLLCLGDLSHARGGHTPRVLAQWAQWRARHASMQVELVLGNHDRHAGVPAALDVVVHPQPLWLPPFWLCHAPEDVAGDAPGYRLCGHEHPGMVLAALGDRLRVPCFVIGERVAVLPAFGALTGLHEHAPTVGEVFYAVAGGRLFGPLGATP